MPEIDYPDITLRTKTVSDASVIGNLSAGFLQLGAYGTYDVQMNPLSLTITNTVFTPQRQAVLSNEQLNIEEGTLLTNIKPSVVKTQTTSDGTEYKVELVSNPALYMEGMGLILDTTSPSSVLARTSLTHTQLQSDVPIFNMNIQNLSLNGDESIEGQVITADANGKPVWETPQPIVSTLEYFITATSPFFQYPPVAPTQALITSYQYYGWYFINSVALRKIDWYFAPDYAMTVADVKGLYLNYFNITTTSNDNLPYLTIYTKPTGSNDIIPGFAHSSATYIANFTPAVATPYCSFMNISGVQPDPFPYGHSLEPMILSPVQPNPRGQYLGTEEVLAISIGTNSTSEVGQCNFIFQKLGICLEQGNAELIMNPQNVLDPTVTTLTATTSVKPTTILDLNNSAGTAGQVLSSTGTGIDWVDNPTPYISSSGVASGGITSLPSINAVGAMTIGGDVATTGLTIGRSGYNTTMGGNLAMGGNDITGIDAIDGNSASLSIGTGAGTTSTIIIGKAGVAVDLVNTVRVGASGSVSAGTAGQVITSAGVGQPTKWANPTLPFTIGAELQPNASATSPFQLFTSTPITGALNSTYLFMFRTNLTSTNSAGTDNELNITLTTTAGNTTPTTSNSFNVLNPSVTILNTRPDEATSLALTKHYGAIGTAVRQDRTLTFEYLYTFPSATTTTFGVWSWTNTSFPTSSFVRKNVQFNYIKMS
jgi:hypothetical protein